MLALADDASWRTGSWGSRGLLAKPIVDLAIGLTTDQELTSVRERLKSARWTYRGDAGAQGGHVFVLESASWHRIAHAHVVEHLGERWSNYLRLRDLLRRSPGARQRYEDIKLRLLNEVGATAPSTPKARRRSSPYCSERLKPGATHRLVRSNQGHARI
jgi:GrpB-like predicted nucleotidyltransferase (UPF0157 family)